MNYITDIEGIYVGHYTDGENKTGCTAVLTPTGAVAGVSIRGAASGTRETPIADPTHSTPLTHGIMLCGGSAYGLAACCGAMDYLEEHGFGFDTGFSKVPIVMGAVLFDLSVGNAKVRPTAQNGYEACVHSKTNPRQKGQVGAGTGATVSKFFGFEGAQPGGIGCATVELGDGILVSAFVAVNALGDIYDESGNILVHSKTGLSAKEFLLGGKITSLTPNTNTTIGVVATNARLDKAQANRLAAFGQNGLSKAIQPAQTSFDGDTIFALSIGDKVCDTDILGLAADVCVHRAIIDAVT